MRIPVFHLLSRSGDPPRALCCAGSVGLETREEGHTAPAPSVHCSGARPFSAPLLACVCPAGRWGDPRGTPPLWEGPQLHSPPVTLNAKQMQLKKTQVFRCRLYPHIWTKEEKSKMKKKKSPANTVPPQMTFRDASFLWFLWVVPAFGQ
ncbi:hypothetical protein HJG60_010066 [Phyllostomus discolor]|uniref:Uncharacterized protein n=1 Tax=Phyllostomus discolor TaxID=89673 RepID=A0A834EJJ8_9CHIR|nr:hypothetical protein HJG60_010066 [Phyllostomus discolor]